tara:strand:+ start:148 stop:444 length:297 start_codon:yes stop_codon:yes gene_type:complete
VVVVEQGEGQLLVAGVLVVVKLVLLEILLVQEHLGKVLTEVQHQPQILLVVVVALALQAVQEILQLLVVEELELFQLLRAHKSNMLEVAVVATHLRVG